MPVIATAGHVDHGKSSLIQKLTGTHPDRLLEEQQKGMTIDLGFAHITTAHGTVLSFIDVPGHSDFIRTMISGVSGVDVALLVIDVGEGWKPQTEEHLGILEVLGVSRGIVALTKCDRVDPAHIAHIRQLVTNRLETSTVDWTDIVETSVVTHQGIEQLVEALESLIQDNVGQNRPGTPRLWIDRVFTMKGAGVVVTGTLDSASLTRQDTLVVSRTGAPIRIRDIHVHGQSVEVCEPGSRCALNISGVTTQDLQRGDALVRSDGWLVTDVVDARIQTLPVLERPLQHRGSFTFHIGSHFQSATVRMIGAEELHAGETGVIRIRYAHPLPLVPGDRYLIRDTSTQSTVGGGVILDIAPRHRLSRSQPDGTLASIMSGRGFVQVDYAQLLTGLQLEPVVGQWFALPEVVAETTTTLRRELATHAQLDLAILQPYERELLATFQDVSIDAGVARLAESTPLEQHPTAQSILNWGVNGPSSADLDRNIIRQLVQRGVIYEHDFIAFHRDTLEALRITLTELWDQHPEGFTLAQLRDALGITRKHAVPLAECLDKYGLTKRRGDIRLPGHRW